MGHPLTSGFNASGANVRVADGNFGRTWNGLSFSGITLDTNQEAPHVNSCSGGTWDTTIVTWWNRYYADGFSLTKRQAIMVHELGHALGLAHTGSSSSCTAPIMSTNISELFDDCGFWRPRQDDINGANALY